MACVAEFGIINEFEEDKDYSNYEPLKYNCVSIDDNILDYWWNKLSSIKTYFHCYSRPDFGLARYGVTLIPPESLETFYSIVSTDTPSKSSRELTDLMNLLQKAICEKKYVIHYGI